MSGFLTQLAAGVLGVGPVLEPRTRGMHAQLPEAEDSAPLTAAEDQRALTDASETEGISTRRVAARGAAPPAAAQQNTQVRGARNTQDDGPRASASVGATPAPRPLAAMPDAVARSEVSKPSQSIALGPQALLDTASDAAKPAPLEYELEATPAPSWASHELAVAPPGRPARTSVPGHSHAHPEAAAESTTRAPQRSDATRAIVDHAGSDSPELLASTTQSTRSDSRALPGVAAAIRIESRAQRKATTDNTGETPRHIVATRSTVEHTGSEREDSSELVPVASKSAREQAGAELRDDSPATVIIAEQPQPKAARPRVTIHIGRIDVRAVGPEPAAARAEPVPGLSLDAYLQRLGRR